MKGFRDALELFEHFPETEFDKTSVLAQCYCSQATLYRVLAELVSADLIRYREIGTAMTKKRLWRLTPRK